MVRWRLCLLLALWLGGWALGRLVFASRGDSLASYSGSSHASHALALSADGALLLVANPDSNSLTFVDTRARAILAEIDVGVEPRAVALTQQHAFVANRGDNSVSVVDLPSRTVLVTLPVGNKPGGIAVSPDGRFLAVAEQGDDTVRFLDSTTLKSLTRHPVADRPTGLAFTVDSRHLLISHLLSGQVTRLSVLPHVGFLPVIGRPGGEAIRPESYADSAPAVSNPLQLIIPTWPHVAPAPAIIVNKTGDRAYLPQTMANGQGLNTQFDTTVFPRVSVLNLETWSHQSGEHISLPESDQPVGLPWDVALARDDEEVWVVNAASNDISVIDISTPSLPRRVVHLAAGDNPQGIVLSPDGAWAYVNNTLAGTISVINTALYTVTAVIPVTEIPLPPLLLTGKRLFHSSARPELSRAAWISCNTCHIEGEHDGRTWLLQYLGEVPPGQTPVITRNTTSLLGLIETYPLRWSAEWDESADSEFSIRFEQFGTGLIDGEMHPPLGPPNQGRSAELDALAAFIDSLPAASRVHTLTEAERRGQVIFESAGTQCLSCHPPPLYTDLHGYDVGTAGGGGEWLGPVIDTPSLRFLYDSAPYLHDGSAADLAAVLTTKNPADEHGVTGHLTPQEVRDLVHFLLALPYQ